MYYQFHWTEDPLIRFDPKSNFAEKTFILFFLTL